jgi:hypothetical protein
VQPRTITKIAASKANLPVGRTSTSLVAGALAVYFRA